MEFVANFLRSELALGEMDLKIQRCHRALVPRPPRHAPPRPFVLNVLQNQTKDRVITTAWKKKQVFFKDTRVYFHNDYPTEVMRKRREYAGIRRVLKERGVRFQTPPPAKLKVFLTSGPRSCSDAKEAADDLRREGFPIAQDTDPSQETTPGAVGEHKRPAPPASTSLGADKTQALIQPEPNRCQQVVWSFVLVFFSIYLMGYNDCPWPKRRCFTGRVVLLEAIIETQCYVLHFWEQCH